MRKGQVSIEYMLVLGFMFVLLVPLLYFYVTTQRDATNTLTEGQLLKVGNSISDAAERVYFAGEPAQEVVEVYFPEGIKTVTVDNTSIVFVVSGGSGSYDLVVRSVAPLNGTLQTYRGTHYVRIQAVGGVVELSD